MKKNQYINLAQSVEFSFANLFSLMHSLEDFDAILASVKADQNYFSSDFAYDMRSGLLHFYTDPSELREAPGFILHHPRQCSQIAIKKIMAIKACGMMDIFSRIILSDFCRLQSFEAREAAQGHTPELFNACLKSSHFYSRAEELDNHFIPSVMMLTLASETPLDVVKASGQCGGDLFDFIRFTKRKDLVPLLNERYKRHLLEDDLSL